MPRRRPRGAVCGGAIVVYPLVPTKGRGTVRAAAEAPRTAASAPLRRRCSPRRPPGGPLGACKEGRRLRVHPKLRRPGRLRRSRLPPSTPFLSPARGLRRSGSSPPAKGLAAVRPGAGAPWPSSLSHPLPSLRGPADLCRHTPRLPLWPTPGAPCERPRLESSGTEAGITTRRTGRTMTPSAGQRRRRGPSKMVGAKDRDDVGEGPAVRGRRSRQGGDDGPARRDPRAAVELPGRTEAAAQC